MSHQGNGDQNHSERSLHTHWDSCYLKNGIGRKENKCLKEYEEIETHIYAGGNVKWFNCFGR